MTEKLLPPSMGTHSGIVRPKPLMPEIALLMIAITAFSGALHSATSPSKAEPKICLIPSHAWLQLPENTPVIKVIKPWKIP